MLNEKKTSNLNKVIFYISNTKKASGPLAVLALTIAVKIFWEKIDRKKDQENDTQVNNSIVSITNKMIKKIYFQSIVKLLTDIKGVESKIDIELFFSNMVDRFSSVFVHPYW